MPVVLDALLHGLPRLSLKCLRVAEQIACRDDFVEEYHCARPGNLAQRFQEMSHAWLDANQTAIVCTIVGHKPSRAEQPIQCHAAALAHRKLWPHLQSRGPISP